ncbi:hypothetical protein [Bathymodiolus japonicus methanotrophic gill symbiont]|nr:hypothetical protein [Bathymodiolus japonicus methanotrophic gill symbiont]
MRKLVLGIPAQASSKNLTRPLMPPAAPIRVLSQKINICVKINCNLFL